MTIIMLTRRQSTCTTTVSRRKGRSNATPRAISTTPLVEVAGQDKALERIEQLRKRGLSGRSFWLSGQSGTGKTTIAKLLAAEVADPWSTVEIDGGQVMTEVLDELDSQCRQRPFGRGFCLIVNEAHGLRGAAVRRLLVTLEALPAWVTVIFTTTVDQYRGARSGWSHE